MGTIERFGEAKGLLHAINLVNKWFEKLSRMATVKTEPQYNFYLWLGIDDQEVECRVLGDRTVKEIHKTFKGDTI